MRVASRFRRPASPHVSPGPWLLVLVSLVLSGCPANAPVDGVVQVLPAAVTVSPGEQVRFSVTSPWGSDVVWTIQPVTAGTIDQAGLFTASPRVLDQSETCTVVAALRSDPTRIGLAVVLIRIDPADKVSASGGKQVADGVEVESIVLEPFNTVTSSDAAGTVQSRSGFYPSGNTSP